MGIQQQQQHQQQGEPPLFPGDFVDYAAQYETSDRQPRDASGGRNGRYRRPRSPSLDDDSRFTTTVASTEPSEVTGLHDAVLAQAPHQQVSPRFPASQQRVVPTNQRTQARAAGPRSGPPSAANAAQNRRSYPQPPHVQSQGLPPYATGPDEWSPASREPASAGAAAPNGGYSRRRTERQSRRQSSTSGGPAPGGSDPQMSGANSPRTAAEAQTSPRVPSQTHQPAALRAPSPPPTNAAAPPNGVSHLGLGDSAADISRLNSPSISKSVLEPLQRKMYEYHSLMEEAQGQMARLDDELRQLQERRHQAEQRFVDAKTKHDEYERQHLDVERALRGDYGPPMHQQQMQMQQQQQQPQMYNNSPPAPARPASSLMSYDERPMSGRSSFQGKKGKFRISLFGR
ncbi:hypothetical protein CPLU01_06181 [Colletotrichum plurivorum]|uniref:Uncharacterized protein n=1 Tax=Colletotrichum plurivorum TaxID=2175906 RepID=A0A8H6KJR4_9PEZI|nr:hypothetical protein CPLU01_06181 [Colletotrichum plurivorum]